MGGPARTVTEKNLHGEEKWLEKEKTTVADRKTEEKIRERNDENEKLIENTAREPDLQDVEKRCRLR